MARNCPTLQCYECSEAGHMAKECPKAKTEEPAEKGKAKAKAYSLT
jgi:hypothetical protein